MKTTIIKIGNSKGIRIPKTILSECKITDEVDLLVDDKKIIIQPFNKKPRIGWASKFKSMSDNKHDKLLIHDSIDLNSKDWEW